MRVSFGELKIGPIAQKNLQRIVNANWASGGALVTEFEQLWSSTFGYKNSIATGSGTDACIALCSSLYDFGAKRGDEIICPALTFVATANAILASGFTPKFVDVKKDTLNIDPDLIEAAITDKTIAICVVHLMGRVAEMEKIMEIARKHNLHVIEDCCEAHGASRHGQLVGTFGIGGAFSFYAAHLVICGEGGMVSTNDDKVSSIVKSVRTHGRRNANAYFDFERFGLNLKMNDLEAAIGLEGLNSFFTTWEKRRSNYQKMINLLSDLKYVIQLYPEDTCETVSPHAFPLLLRHEKSSDLYMYLEKNGIQCKTLFGSLPTQHSAFDWMGHKKGDFPVSEHIGEYGLHFGIHQYLTDDDIQWVSDCIHTYFG